MIYLSFCLCSSPRCDLNVTLTIKAASLAEWICEVSGSHAADIPTPRADKLTRFPLIQPALLQWAANERPRYVANFATLQFPEDVRSAFPVLAARCIIDATKATQACQRRRAWLRRKQGLKPSLVRGRIPHAPKRRERHNKRRARTAAEADLSDEDADEAAAAAPGAAVAPTPTASRGVTHVKQARTVATHGKKARKEATQDKKAHTGAIPGKQARTKGRQSTKHPPSTTTPDRKRNADVDDNPVDEEGFTAGLAPQHASPAGPPLKKARTKSPKHPKLTTTHDCKRGADVDDDDPNPVDEEGFTTDPTTKDVGPAGPPPKKARTLAAAKDVATAPPRCHVANCGPYGVVINLCARLVLCTVQFTLCTA